MFDACQGAGMPGREGDAKMMVDVQRGLQPCGSKNLWICSIARSARKNPFAETKVISTNGAVCSQSFRWRVGWPCRSIGPPTVLRVTTPLASTAKFHLLTSFQNHGLTIRDPGANQNGSKIVRKGSIATRNRETTVALSPAAKWRAREKRLLGISRRDHSGWGSRLCHNTAFPAKRTLRRTGPSAA